jgi:DNA-binding CsgD family transcriptional regulator
MARRGRPPYPDVLTPREWEVLALLREGRSNEEVAERLGISLGGAKYHVSEILGKLGVESREEAARWAASGARAWWTGALAPIGLLLRRLNAGWLARGAAAVAAVGIAAGVGLLVWGLLRTHGGDGTPTVLSPTPAPLVYVGGTIDSISDQQLVVRDLEGQLVPIHVEHAEGPEAQFCDHRTPIPMCMVRSEASPSKGEGVCVMARLMPGGELIAWLVHLDSQCRQVPAPTSVPTP